jgi:methionyl-tRNA synthetase
LFGSQRVETYPDAKLGQHTGLTYDPAGATGRWALSDLKPGQALRQPGPLFKKLEEKLVEEERARLGQPN